MRPPIVISRWGGRTSSVSNYPILRSSVNRILYNRVGGYCPATATSLRQILCAGGSRIAKHETHHRRIQFDLCGWLRFEDPYDGYRVLSNGYPTISGCSRQSPQRPYEFKLPGKSLRLVSRTSFPRAGVEISKAGRQGNLRAMSICGGIAIFAAVKRHIHGVGKVEWSYN
jgi:hypothetical protein